VSQGLLFGTAGTPLSSKARSTYAGIERVYELELDCMEVEFVQGVRMNEGMASSIGKLAQAKGIRLTAHAPYFINLNAQEPEKRLASKERLLHTIRICSLFGGKGAVFHAAFYMNQPPDRVYDRVKEELQEVASQLTAQGTRVWLRVEVMGKGTQFGTLDEVLRLSAEIEGVAPCIDFAHWHARTGRFNSSEEFVYILDRVEEVLGRRGIEDMHLHISGIDYGSKGERKHLNLRDSDFHYEELLRALKERGAKGLVICESPNREEDALLLKQTYEAL
jgi:deoxyribonuclease-4